MNKILNHDILNSASLRPLPESNKINLEMNSLNSTLQNLYKKHLGSGRHIGRHHTEPTNSPERSQERTEPKSHGVRGS